MLEKQEAQLLLGDRATLVSFENVIILSSDTVYPSSRIRHLIYLVVACTVYEIFAFKLYCDLETEVRGHSRSSTAALFDRAHTTLYSSSIVNMALSITVSVQIGDNIIHNCTVSHCQVVLIS